MTLTQSIPEQMSTTTTSRDEQEFRVRSAIRDRVGTMDVRPTGRFQVPWSLATRDIGDLLITNWHSPDAEGVRNSTMASKEAEAVLVFTVTTGRQIIQTPEKTVVLRPGAVLVMSTRTTGRFVVPETLTKRTVRVPLTALAPFDTGPGLPDFLCLDAACNPLARLTHDFLDGVDKQLDQMSPADVEVARNALLVLIAGMIRATRVPDVSETDFLPFLRQALEDWIVNHLSEGAIRVDDLAAAHHVAPRTVHRAFASAGDTMGSVVRAHRLAAARNDLVHTAASIAAVAHRWGFCDASHLGREFRREFSMSPGDYRAAHGIA
jgi:AraC family transcriptional activator of tynA and feaB